MRFEPWLSEARARRIFEDAIGVLEHIGVECADEGIYQQIRARVPVARAGNRITFARRDLLAYWEKRRPLFPSPEDGPITIGGHWHSWFLCDPETNAVRGASEREAIDMARLSEMLGTGGGPIPVAPEGLPPRLHTLMCERLALTHTRSMGGGLTATDPREIRALVAMNQAAGRTYTLALEPLISPLRLNPEVMRAYFDWADDRNLRISIFTPIPMAGATAPLAFPAALVQVLAEALALDYLFFTMSEGRLLDGFSLRLDPFDMRHMNIAFGTPQWCLFKQALVELWRNVTGGQPVFGMFRTNSRVVDAQAVMERSMSFLWQTSLGIRHFSAVGQMCVDEVFSPVCALLDSELAQYGQRLLTGLDGLYDDAQDVMDVIGRGVQAGSYLSEEETVDNLRALYDRSTMADASNYPRWQASGGRTMQQLAWKRAQEKIARHEYHLPDCARREIEAIYAGVVNTL